MNHANDNLPIAHATGLTFLSVCSGIEAASVAWHPLGWRAVAYSEIEKFPSAVLAHHYPDVPNLGDFTKIDVRTLQRVDILAGGTPCQAFSVAGLRQSLADERGNLSLEFVRLAHELAANNGLRNVVWENVVGVLSTKDNAFGCFLAGLVGADSAIDPPSRRGWARHGMVAGPKGRAAWAVKDGQFFGVAQRRRRVIVVADFGNGADPASVLFEPDGVFRDSPPSREAGKDVAPTISARTKGGGGLGTDFDLDGGLVEYAIQAGALRTNPASGPDGVGVQERIAYTLEARSEVQAVYAPEIARCVATREGSSQDYESTTMVAVGVHGDVAHTLKAEGADASEDGTGRGTPVIAFSAKDYGADASVDLAPTLRSGNHSESHANGGVMPAIAFNWYASASQSLPVESFLPPLKTTMQPAVLTSAVRRLTPMECERLQGFWDNYTRIPIRRYKAKKVTRTRPEDMWECIDGQWWLMAADGPRYKALGNSWAVPKFAWLGKRIQALMPVAREAANDNTTEETA
jgi:DNA (cytosine-5)-methyltransferase 1